MVCIIEHPYISSLYSIHYKLLESLFWLIFWLLHLLLLFFSLFLLHFLFFKDFLHSLQLFEACIDLLHHFISLFLLLFQLFAQLAILILNFLHALLIVLGDLHYFLYRNCLFWRFILVVDANHIHYLSLKCFRLVLIFLCKHLCLLANLVKLLNLLRTKLFLNWFRLFSLFLFLHSNYSDLNHESWEKAAILFNTTSLPII